MISTRHRTVRKWPSKGIQSVDICLTFPTRNDQKRPETTRNDHKLPAIEIRIHPSSANSNSQTKWTQWTHTVQGALGARTLAYVILLLSCSNVEVDTDISWLDLHLRYPKDSVLLSPPDIDVQVHVLIRYGNVGWEWIANGCCSFDLVHEAVFVFFPVIWWEDVEIIQFIFERQHAYWNGYSNGLTLALKISYIQWICQM